MEYLTYIVVAAVGAWAGWHVRGIVLLANLSRDPDKIIGVLKEIKRINQEEEGKTNPDRATELAIERHGEMLYAFVKDTDQFIAQGPNLDSLLNEAKKRFPDRKFFGVIAKEDTAKDLA